MVESDQIHYILSFFFMTTLTPTSTKTVVGFAVVGGVAIAAMVFFGFYGKKTDGQKDMNYLTPGYGSIPDQVYRPISETPIIEEQKPRPIEPEMKNQEGTVINQADVMLKTDLNVKGN